MHCTHVTDKNYVMIIMLSVDNNQVTLNISILLITSCKYHLSVFQAYTTWPYCVIKVPTLLSLFEKLKTPDITTTIYY